jgi:hypothetical protein
MHMNHVDFYFILNEMNENFKKKTTLIFIPFGTTKILIWFVIVIKKWTLHFI